MNTQNFEYNCKIDIKFCPKNGTKIAATRVNLDRLNCEIDEIEGYLRDQVETIIKDLRYSLYRECLPTVIKQKFALGRLETEYGVCLIGEDND